MKKIISVMLFSLIAAFCFCQQQRVFPKRPLVKAVDPKDSIKLTDLEVEVDIEGNIATTYCTMLFKNTTSKTLEGTFEFPLSENQVLTGYALDINGKMREGVVVEKDKARVVLEDIERRNVDPGLVEMTQGNNFKTRIYPFSPNGTRRVRIVYQEVLKKDKKTNKITYKMNNLGEEIVENITMDVRYYYRQNTEVSVKGKETKTRKTKKGLTSHLAEQNYNISKLAEEDFTFDADDKANSFVESYGVESYFYFTKDVTSGIYPKGRKNNITVLFDASNSAKNRDIAKEIELLKEYIKSNIGNTKTSSYVNVSIYPFADRLLYEDALKLKVTGEAELKQIEKYIKELPLDGATGFAKIDWSKLPSKAEILLFSDGLFNYGEEKENKEARVINVITSGTSNDYNALKKLARDSLGNYINLSKYTVKEALKQLKNEQLKVIKYEYNDEEIKDVYPLPGTIVDGDTLTVTGILESKEAQLKICLGYGDKIIHNLYAKLSVFDAPESDMNIPRIWGGRAIDELSGDYEANRDTIISLSKEFKIVSKETSFIVLENVHDYVRYGIVPPDELLDQYNALVSNSSMIKTPYDGEQGISERVYRAYKEYKRWWNAKPGELKPKEPKGGRIYYDMATAPAAAGDAQNDYFEGVMVDENMTYAAEEVLSEEEITTSALTRSNSTSAKQAASNSGKGPSVNLQAWDGKAKYITELKKTREKDMYKKYLELKNEYEESPSFYMEVADYFRKCKMNDKAQRILSNLAEINLENSDVLRALGNKLVEWEDYENAEFVFAKLVKLRPEAPLFLRDLGLAQHKNGKSREALDTLYKILVKEWDSRYSEIELTVLNDMKSIINEKGYKLSELGYDKELFENLPVDIRIVLTWNTDDCDIDLWVTEPSGEKCSYRNKFTNKGGRLSRDFTRGYGPEEYCIKKAIKGEYKIEVDYYGTSSQRILQPVIVQAEVYTNFGKPNETKQVLTLQLDTVKGTYKVGTIKF